jgi:hypothetical protein
MALDRPLGQFPYPYLQSTSYDAAGRVTQRTLGGTSQRVQTTYEYYWWSSQGGRLYRIKSGTPFVDPPATPDPTKFQDLYYNYDAVGNILHIYDYKAGPQTQTFSYDPLYRLLSANVSGGSGGLYSDTYSYNTANGNLLTKKGLTYTYGSHVHGVTALSNGNTYSYDANGNPSQAQGKL